MPNKIVLSDEGLLRISQLVGPGGLLPVGRSTIWARVRAGTFPRPVRLGPRTVAWRVADVREWLDRQRGGEGRP
ncbi:MAG: helix-turn-helix transcriptional regulator [bacterium]